MRFNGGGVGLGSRRARDAGRRAAGEAVAAAMDLLVRYGEVLGAERLVDTDDVCGANLFGSRHGLVCGSPTPDGAFSEHGSLDAQAVSPPSPR